ncbi:hypothetical protein JOL79_11170 [Microbispora sp. RL4-1S]|uniref:Tetratricopeptide repeat protein n=1 Tax=Microbispora oryzae TaxID=2806554 RepID=A0A940WK56_9ACTN|nr:tetratricopeptide repeat protein [Microbispora oryzae]MBP2704373.1 hypothetical protein [Microbispora oryzae]
MGEETHPFDAHRTLMCEDRAGSLAGWQVSSLLTEIADVLMVRFMPENDHEELYGRFEAAASELDRRGLDADSIIRYGMLSEILGPLLIELLIGQILPGEDRGDQLWQTRVDVEGWRKLLRMHSPPTGGTEEVSDLVNTTAEVFAPLLNWAAQASMSDLVTLRLPDHEQFWKCIPLPRDYRAITIQYRWLVERLTATYLKQWTLASLLLEYRFRQNLQSMSFPAWVIEARDVPLDDVAKSIAHRTAVDWEPASEGLPQPKFLLAEMANHARGLLKAGRAADAAALFEFALEKWPDDIEARNNLGFCLISSDPERALTHLNTAAREGYEPALVNTYNRMCCYIALHQPRAALEVAELWWQAASLEAHAGLSATLWVPSRDGWDLQIAVEATSALITLAVQLASGQGWQDEERVWRARAA